ncbi:MAG: tetratricopeptide repeat protein [Thalassobaculaceae bacterium]|nr:tetratricopeptide repeat protein [Thalassobaculaceae bacterium]
MILAVLGIGLGQPGTAAAQSDDAAGQSALYDACLTQARSEPKVAYEAALDWHKAGGGLPARHCAAVALLGVGAYEEAAARLEKLAGEVPDSRLDLRLGLIAQAAQGWMMSGRAERAEQLLSLVVNVHPDDPQLRADRAVARLSLGDYWAAIDDLDIAIEKMPDDVELLLYRASAYRYLEVPALARDDVARALARDPNAPGAWLERGILERQAGDKAAARRAWIKVLELAPDGATGDAARARLEALDVSK